MPSSVSNARVSHRGQTSLPAELRHRWGIDEGGEVTFIDLGDAALVVPGGVSVARAELRAGAGTERAGWSRVRCVGSLLLSGLDPKRPTTAPASPTLARPAQPLARNLLVRVLVEHEVERRQQHQR